MIRAEGLAFRRGSKEILRGIDLHVKRGESAVLVGPNGAGKTTLLRILSGELAADGGAVAVDGVPLAASGLADLARRRAVLCQDTAVPFSFRVKEIIGLGLMPWNAVVLDPAPLVDEVARETDVLHLLDRDIMSLSGGERQRVQLARALVQLLPGGYRGKLLLLDEPMSALDLGQERRVVKLLARLREEGLTVVSVMHDLNTALEMADRVCILHEGRMLADTSPFDPALPARLSLAFDTPLVSHGQPGRRTPLVLPATEVAPEGLPHPIAFPSKHEHHDPPSGPGRTRLKLARPAGS